METGNLKDFMDGGVATERARDLLGDLCNDARYNGLAARVAEALRGAYREGFEEGFQRAPREERREAVMRQTCDALRDYMRQHVVEGNAKAQRDLLTRVESDVSAAFGIVVGKHTDVSREKRGEMLQAFVRQVQTLVDSVEFDIAPAPRGARRGDF